MPRRDLVAEDITQDELERLADISDSDVQAARAAWKRDAPARFRNLLEAATDEPEEEDGDA